VCAALVDQLDANRKPGHRSHQHNQVFVTSVEKEFDYSAADMTENIPIEQQLVRDSILFEELETKIEPTVGLGAVLRISQVRHCRRCLA